MAAQWEGEMELGTCSGSLQITYYRDNRLGSGVDHGAVAKAVETLPQAFNDGAGGKRIWLQITLPLILVGFLVVVIAVGTLFFGSASGPFSSSFSSMPSVGPGPSHRRMNPEFESSATSMRTSFMISAALMLGWFASSGVLFCLHRQAIEDGFGGVQRQLGKLNDSMHPLNFSLRKDTQVVSERVIGEHGVGPGTHRTTTIHRYFLVIFNAKPAVPVVTATVVGNDIVVGNDLGV
jgi:hypothetical protein